ncbi:MAG: DUF4422 domain-containing protein [Bacteroidales bacterium]|nr:DUF4422 domain-containing protein [Bacteroidales bacterium]
MPSTINTKVLVCCHKADIFEKSDPYFPIHVGKANSDKELGIQGDNDGENISEKNESYCELTGMYWAWKNLQTADIVGLCHYRRYFDFHKQTKQWMAHTACSTASFGAMDRSIPSDILLAVSKGKVVVPKFTNCQLNMMADYCCSHISDDFMTLQDVIIETQPENVKQAFFKANYCTHSRPSYNMFIMKRADFDDYCSWLFSILEEVEKRVDITHYSALQKRIFGYMSERLMNVWLIANNKEIITKPVIWYTDIDDSSLHTNLIKYKIRSFMNFLSVKLSAPRYSNIMR